MGEFTEPKRRSPDTANGEAAMSFDYGNADEEFIKLVTLHISSGVHQQAFEMMQRSRKPDVFGKSEFFFYLNASDPIHLLHERVDVRDQRVLTVAGSGDFLPLFVEGGAAAVDVFDRCVPAIFYQELKAVALRSLSWTEYQQLINTWTQPKGHLCDHTLFEKIQSKLSPLAAYFFEELLFIQRVDSTPVYKDERGSVAVYRPRRMPDGSTNNNLAIGDVITTEQAYHALQEKMRAIPLTFQLMYLQKLIPTLSAQKHDVAYISNIGLYQKDTLKLAYHILKKGVPRVLFTCRMGLGDIERSETVIAGNRLAQFHGQVLHPDTTFQYILPDGVVVNLRVIGSDSGVANEMLLEATKYSHSK